MQSDDLAKNLAQIYTRQSATSPSLISGSEPNYRTSEEKFYIYPGLENAEEEGDELFSQSFDINFAQEGPFFRFRTNTDAKMDKMNDMKRRQQNIKTVKCDDSMVKFNEELQDDEELFIRKDLSKMSLVAKRSKLTEQLENLPPIAVNKFRVYSCFEGVGLPSNEVRTIKVFIMPFPKNQRDYPIRCCVQSTAKVEEFIGFILFKCTQDYPEVAQQAAFTDVKDYGLFIAEETGEPDPVFPALDITEQVQRFQFDYLALAKRSDSSLHKTPKPTAVVVVKTPMTPKPPPSEDITQNEKDLFDFVESQIYRAYRVFLITKKHFRSEIQLGISGENIEIDPVQERNSNYFFKPFKAIHFSMDSVASCEVTSRKSSRFEFKIAHNPMFLDPLSFGPSTSLHETTTPTSYTLKIHTFESDPRTAEEIVSKVNNILVLRTSSVRQDYLIRQSHTKKSFMRKKKFPI